MPPSVPLYPSPRKSAPNSSLAPILLILATINFPFFGIRISLLLANDVKTLGQPPKNLFFFLRMALSPPLAYSPPGKLLRIFVHLLQHIAGFKTSPPSPRTRFWLPFVTWRVYVMILDFFFHLYSCVCHESFCDTYSAAQNPLLSLQFPLFTNFCAPLFFVKLTNPFKRIG